MELFDKSGWFINKGFHTVLAVVALIFSLEFFISEMIRIVKYPNKITLFNVILVSGAALFIALIIVKYIQNLKKERQIKRESQTA